MWSIALGNPSQVEALFFAALDKITGSERASFLESACAGDAELRRQVEKLLEAHPKLGDFLKKPAMEQLIAASESSAADDEVDPSTDGESAVTPRDKGFAAARGDAEESDDDKDGGLDFLECSQRLDSLGRLGQYEVLEVLGKGGFGIVFRAFDDVLQRVVAVKVLAPEMAPTSPARKRFLREARSYAQVRHENVVQVHAVEEKPLPYLVMEFIPGETLQQRLDRTGPLEVGDILRIGRQIAGGLAAAHATDLIHRDIKPANVLIEIGVQEHIKITDFGLARTADDASLTGSGEVSWTPMYMSPEQAAGESLDHRADLFSLGSVLYVMATGRPPFRASNTLAVLRRVAEDQPRPIREVIPEVPEWLCAIVAKLHAKAPADRFRTAQEVADLLADCEAKVKANQEVKNILPVIDVKPKLATARRKWVAAAAVLPTILALAVLEFAGVTHWLRERPTPPLAAKQDPPRVVVPSTVNLVEPAIPLSDADLKRITALTAVEQIEEVRKELKRRNPQFDGVLYPTIEKDAVAVLHFSTDHVKDISPVRALIHLRVLVMRGTRSGRGVLADLSPFTDMSMSCLDLMNNSVSDLTPLRGMKLEILMLWGWCGSDLTPLKGMPLKLLNCGGQAQSQRIDLTPLIGAPLEKLCVNLTHVSDLAPLKDMPLTELLCENTWVSDLAPLRGMNLQTLQVANSKVSDLAPVKGMPLNWLTIKGTSVTVLAPLMGLPLKTILCDFEGPRDAKILRAIKTLETINNVPAKQILQD